MFAAAGSASAESCSCVALERSSAFQVIRLSANVGEPVFAERGDSASRGWTSLGFGAAAGVRPCGGALAHWLETPIQPAHAAPPPGSKFGGQDRSCAAADRRLTGWNPEGFPVRCEFRMEGSTVAPSRQFELGWQGRTAAAGRADPGRQDLV